MKFFTTQKGRKHLITFITIPSIILITILGIIYYKSTQEIQDTNSPDDVATTTDSTSTATTTEDALEVQIVEESLDNTTDDPEPDSTEQPPQPTGNWWDYPAQTIPVTKSGDDLLVLVNKTYFLPPEYQPSDLVALDIANTGGIRVYQGWTARSIILGDLANMGNAANSASINLGIVSAYRSFYTQDGTYNYWVSQVGQTEADKVSARPGHSQHQLGTALDFTTDIGGGDLLWQAFDGTPAANWLADNAWQYGFVQSYPAGQESLTGYSPESWHYRYIGVENAAEWRSSGEILEVWLQSANL